MNVKELGDLLAMDLIELGFDLTIANVQFPSSAKVKALVVWKPSMMKRVRYRLKLRRDRKALESWLDRLKGR